MERAHNCRQRYPDLSEAIAVLMEISNVAQRLASNLAKLADHEKYEGGNVDEQDGRTGCRCRRAAQMR